MEEWPSPNTSSNTWKITFPETTKMRILITAGPTYEPIDPVRFIGNRSSGKMGIAIAEEFAKGNNEVILIKGATELSPRNSAIQQVKVQTAAEMFAACKQYF